MTFETVTTRSLLSQWTQGLKIAWYLFLAYVVLIGFPIAFLEALADAVRPNSGFYVVAAVGYSYLIICVPVILYRMLCRHQDTIELLVGDDVDCAPEAQP